jgi:hypothetical protein
MTSGRAAACAGLLLAAAACRVGEPEPVPIRGDAPRAVAVWPFPQAPEGADVPLLLGGVTRSLAERGYRTTSPEVAAELLRAGGRDAATPPTAEAAATLAADAVLFLVVREFAAEGRRPLRDASWDLEWRLLSARSGGVLWSFSHRGTWHPPLARDENPHRALDATPDVVPIGGHRELHFRDAEELLASLHRMALARLPRGAP